MNYKRVIPGIILLISINLFSQNPISFEKVIKTDSIGKGVLFSAINDWFATNYTLSKGVIQMSDKDAGIIIGKSAYYYKFRDYESGSSWHGNINYTIKVYVKYNRYKVILTDFIHHGQVTELGLITDHDIYAKKGMFKKLNNEAWNEIKVKLELFSEQIFLSLYNKTNTKNVNDDDW